MMITTQAAAGTASSTLFDSITLTDSSPRAHTESQFVFWNRVAGPVFDRIRSVLEDWFDHYPSVDKSDLRQRFRSSDERVMLGALLELHQAEAVRRCGYRVTPHPEVPGSSRRPDFLVEAPQSELALTRRIAG